MILTLPLTVHLQPFRCNSLGVAVKVTPSAVTFAIPLLFGIICVPSPISITYIYTSTFHKAGYQPDQGNLAGLDGGLRRVFHTRRLNRNHFDYNNNI